MSWKAVEWARSMPVRPSGRKFVLVTLALHTGKNGWSCYPGQRRIADHTCLSVRAVRDHLSALVRMGLILREPRYSAQGRRLSDLIHLQPSLEEIAANSAGNFRDYRQETADTEEDPAAESRIEESIESKLEETGGTVIESPLLSSPTNVGAGKQAKCAGDDPAKQPPRRRGREMVSLGDVLSGANPNGRRGGDR